MVIHVVNCDSNKFSGAELLILVNLFFKKIVLVAPVLNLELQSEYRNLVPVQLLPVLYEYGTSTGTRGLTGNKFILNLVARVVPVILESSRRIQNRTISISNTKFSPAAPLKQRINYQILILTRYLIA